MMKIKEYYLLKNNELKWEQKFLIFAIKSNFLIPNFSQSDSVTFAIALILTGFIVWNIIVLLWH